MFDNVGKIGAHKVDATIVQVFDKLRFGITSTQSTSNVGVRRFLIATEDPMLNLIEGEIHSSNTVEEGLSSKYIC